MTIIQNELRVTGVLPFEAVEGRAGTATDTPATLLLPSGIGSRQFVFTNFSAVYIHLAFGFSDLVVGQDRLPVKPGEQWGGSISERHTHYSVRAHGTGTSGDYQIEFGFGYIT